MKSTIDFIKQGAKARLIPVVADSKREERATSVLLATFMIIPDYAEAVLSEAGAKIGKYSDIKCYTEIVFSDKEINQCRPDGLIVISRGQKSWSALVESKIGNQELTKDQLECYLDVAKAVGADALITISNQFATLPTHHPVSVSKVKTKSVELYHFSWMSLLSKAIVMSDNRSVADREQAIVLKELVRYLDHESSGISPISSMGGSWKNICESIHQNAPIQKGAKEVVDVVEIWHQLLRYLAITLSMATGSKVDVILKKVHLKEPEVRLKDDVNTLIEKNILMGELVVPNAAAPILIVVDIAKRNITIAMKLAAPSDRARPTAPINWLTRQLRNKEVKSDLFVRAMWPGRVQDTQGRFEFVKDDPSIIVPDGMKGLPRELELFSVYDLGSKFKGSKIFVDLLSDIVPRFYKEVGENLTKWIPDAPKVKPISYIEQEDSIEEGKVLEAEDGIIAEADDYGNAELAECEEDLGMVALISQDEQL